MRKYTVALGVLALAVLVTVGRARDDKKDGHGEGKDGHVLVTPDKLKWGPAPPSLPPGAQVAILVGDPRTAGSMYVMRVKMPDGFKVPAHWHPVDENVTVLQGTFLLGRGDKFDAHAAEEMPAGSYSRMPRGMRHFAQAKGETILQVHGVGPFEINYVNPADDPRKKTENK